MLKLQKRNIVLLSAVFLVVFLFSYSISEARSGCCSHHGGVCGCGCCDGTGLSATCAPYYPQCLGGSKLIEPMPPTKPLGSARDKYWDSVNAYMSGSEIEKDLTDFLIKNCKKDCDVNEIKSNKLKGLEVSSDHDGYMMFKDRNEIKNIYYRTALGVIDRLESSGNYPPRESLDDVLVGIYGNNFRTITNSYCQKYATKTNSGCVCDSGYTLEQGKSGYVSSGDVCAEIEKKSDTSDDVGGPSVAAILSTIAIGAGGLAWYVKKKNKKEPK